MVLCKVDIEEDSECKECCKECEEKCDERCVFDKFNIQCSHQLIMNEEVEKIIDKINKSIDEKFNEYVVIFAGHEGLDEIRISVKEDVNRPNNPDDIDIISEYISNNYGSRDYEVIAIDMIEKVKL